jgi:apolipoprotein N-acyltransferase
VWAAGLAVGPWLFDAARAGAAGGPLTALPLTAAAIVLHGGAFVAAFAWLWPWLPAPRCLSGPAIWTLLEVTRSASAGGLEWALLGHTQDGWPALAQIAELGGVPLVSFVVAAPGLALADRRAMRGRGIVTAATLLVLSVAAGTLGARRWSTAAEAGMRLRGVSGGHLSSERDIAYLAATADGPDADLVVWPAHAVPGFVQDDPAALMPVAAASRRHGPLLFGTGMRERGVDDPRYFDSAILLDASASMRGRYDKRRLVPFVDRTPPGLAERSGRPIAPGEGSGIPLALGGLRIGPLLGWESAFPDLARGWARAGADVLVAMADDELPGAGARQLVRFSRFRAIEVRRWMLRVSGTGRTLVVDPIGRSSRRDVVEIAPGAHRSLTLHARAPWLLPVALVGLLLLLAAMGAGRRGARR